MLYEVITRKYLVDQLILALDKMYPGVTCRSYRLGQLGAGYSRNRLLACGIDFRDIKLIGIPKGQREIIEEISCSRVPVRLEKNHQSPIRPALFRRRQCCFNFGRMVTRITSYNVCYTKLLRQEPDFAKAPTPFHQPHSNRILHSDRC